MTTDTIAMLPRPADLPGLDETTRPFLPVPAAVWLLGSTLAAVAGLRRRA